MIKISIYRCKDKVLRERLRRCARFFIERLMPNKRALIIKIFMHEDLYETEKMSGSCGIDDTYPMIKGRINNFKIALDTKLSTSDMLSILAHELTHARQYTTGQLVYDLNRPEISIWEGKEYNDEKIKYENHPWEKDARKNEVILLEELMKSEIWR